jgi:hypothetical protein
VALNAWTRFGYIHLQLQHAKDSAEKINKEWLGISTTKCHLMADTDINFQAKKQKFEISAK